MNLTPEEIGARMDALGLWRMLAPFNWAVRPQGTVFPYFCTVLAGDGKPVKTRFLMLEGWQTLHDFVRVRADRNYGFYTTPAEMPHLELVILSGGDVKLFRHDTGYMPCEATGRARELAAKILWEAYGVMLRVETDPKLPMRFADERAIFARVEGADGAWSDEPLVIPPARPHVERVSFEKALLGRVKDLPLMAGEQLELDLRMLPGLMTREPRPRCVYGLRAIDPALPDVRAIDSRVSVNPEGGLRGMWEGMPTQVLHELVRRGKVPGEIRLCSGRVFRLLRPLCMEVPVKLSLHDSLPLLDAAFSRP